MYFAGGNGVGCKERRLFGSRGLRRLVGAGKGTWRSWGNGGDLSHGDRLNIKDGGIFTKRL